MGQETCQDVPIHVNVNIQTANDTEPIVCTADKELAFRKNHIQKVVNKRVDEFRNGTMVFEDIIVSNACSETLPETTSDRRLMLFRDFNYEISVDCRFCLPGTW